MEKILVGLYVPAAQEHFDLFVPADFEIAALSKMLAEGAADLCSGRYNFSGHEMLVLKDPDLLLNPAKTLADYHVKDGAQLVLL